MLYYDFHSHILPGIDDGAKDVKMSEDILRTLYKQGVRYVALTPHFGRDGESVDEFLRKRASAYKALRSIYDERCMPRLILGAEVYLYKGLSRENCKELAMGDYLLIEMPEQFVPWMNEEIEKMRLKGFNLIFAHIERPFLNYSIKDFNSLIDYNAFLYQVNVSALKNWDLRRFFIKEMKKGGNFVIGSDVHNMTSRGPNFDAKALRGRALGKHFMKEVKYNSEKILKKVGEENASKQY